MPKQRHVKSARKHADDTEAFLNDLLNDNFSDWNLSDDKKEKVKEADKPKLTGTSASIKDSKDTKPEVVEIAKKEEPVPVEPAVVETATPQTTQMPQRKWTRFPKRVPTTPEDKPPENANDTRVKTESVDIPLEIKDAMDVLTHRRDSSEDEIDEFAKFEVRHKKMENYLQNLRQDGKRKHENVDGERTRRSSSSSLESTATTSSSSSQDDMKYFSACTEEELITFKMRDVHEKCNDNICDNWIDDVELALLVMQRKSRKRDLKKDEIKNLLNNILEQK